jgi:hypothetical protein
MRLGSMDTVSRVKGNYRRAVALGCAILWTAVLFARQPMASATAGAGAAAPAQSRGRAGPEPATRLTQADESLILNVPASSPWTDTGVTVGTGDRLEIRAWGRVKYGDADAGPGIGPMGTGRGGACSFVVTDERVPADALVANIASGLTFDGFGVFVGSTWNVSVPVTGSSAREGRLFLGVNHSGMLCDRTGFDSWGFRNKSSGAFTVQLTIRRRR